MSVLVLAVAVLSAAGAQDTIRLAQLQSLAVRQDPRVRQLELEEEASRLRVGRLRAERLPAVMLAARATTQSEVTELAGAVPGFEVPVPPRDRYEIGLNASWLLYDGGVASARRSAERSRLASARAAVEAELHPLRLEVNGAFFRAVLLQERLREVAALVGDLEARLGEIRSRVAAGAALPGDTAAMLAEVLRAEQQREELAAERRASLAVLAELAGVEIGGGAVLVLPSLGDQVERVRSAPPRAHPRHAVFAAERERLQREAALVRAGGRPRLAAFGEYAYGRPGLQLFTEDPHDYWLAGVRLEWVPWDWGARRVDAELLRLRREILVTEEAAFSARVQRQVQEPVEAIDRLRQTLATDARIIALREQVERQARAQLAERAITTAAYVDARTALLEARTALLRHRAELARAEADYLTTLGVEIR